MSAKNTQEKFWSKVVKQINGCWEWQGYCHHNQYGYLSYRGKRVQAHRLAYQFKFGPIPAGLMACHKCDNMKCVNPDHIFLGTHRDNMEDKTRKGRQYIPDMRGERNNSARLTIEQVKQIRALYPIIGSKKLGKIFNQKDRSIRSILTRDRWKIVPCLTEEEISTIRIKYFGSENWEPASDKNLDGLVEIKL